MTSTFTAWAVLLQTEDWSAYAGRYYFPPRLYLESGACITALFETRKEARAAAKHARNATTKAKAVRVTVQIADVKPKTC